MAKFRVVGIGASPSAAPVPSSARLPTVFVQDEVYDLDTSATIASFDSNNFSMSAIYGREFEIAPSFLGWHKNAQPETSLGTGRFFDEFALEKVMLGKWLASPLRCMDCRQTADIVVVPSAFLSSLTSHGWDHDSIMPLNISYFRHFWWQLRKEYYAPRLGGRMPLFVVHMSFSWGTAHTKAKVDLLQALAEQPGDFPDRVVIGALESNLAVTEQALVDEAWSGCPLAELRRRALVRAGGIMHGERSRSSPLIIPLPYPTSVFQPGRFFAEDGTPLPSLRHRNIAVSLLGAEKGSAWIRKSMSDALEARGGENGRLCAEGMEGENCGLGNKVGFWEVALQSTFCVEPAGDTPTRSHLYVAVLSGCVPVIFDGGNSLYDDFTPTWWAWRIAASPSQTMNSSSLPRALEELFVDYGAFAVVFNASDVKAGRIDVLHELLTMPVERLQTLQQGLTRVAPLMTYTPDDQGEASDLNSGGFWWPSDLDNSMGMKLPRDAFAAFQGIVAWEASQ